MPTQTECELYRLAALPTDAAYYRDKPQHILRLYNWGAWEKTGRGFPAGLPAESLYCVGADKSKWQDDGWAEFDQLGRPIDKGTPEAPRLFIHERDAQYVSDIIQAMPYGIAMLLRDEYCFGYRKVYDFHTWEQQKKYVEEAEDAFRTMVKEFPSGKQRVIEMLEQRWRTSDIVRVAKVSRQYVARIKKVINVNRPYRMSPKTSGA